MVPELNVMDAVGVTDDVIVIVIAFEVAVLADTHTASEVKTHVTTSLSASVELVKVAAFVPVLAPFTCHS